MSHQWIDLGSCRSLAVLIESVVSPLFVEHSAPVCLEVDVDISLEVPADAARTADLVRSLAKQALAEMPEGGDLTITACQTERGLELELADTGCDSDKRATTLPIAAAAVGAEVRWQNCPQGGAAVTVIFPRQDGQRRMAA